MVRRVERAKRHSTRKRLAAGERFTRRPDRDRHQPHGEEGSGAHGNHADHRSAGICSDAIRVGDRPPGGANRRSARLRPQSPAAAIVTACHTMQPTIWRGVRPRLRSVASSCRRRPSVVARTCASDPSPNATANAAVPGQPAKTEQVRGRLPRRCGDARPTRTLESVVRAGSDVVVALAWRASTTSWNASKRSGTVAWSANADR